MLSFSIVTCTWDSEPYIAQCIESVSSQTYPHIEHVFVDGGSKDGTLDRIRRTPGNIKHVTGIRGGISNAMNVGVELASGDVIAHLHGDDYYLHDQVITRAARAFESSNAQWLYGRIVSDLAGEQVKPKWQLPEFSLSRLLRGNFIAHPAAFVRRDAFIRSGGFDCSLKYAMDYDLWLRLARMSPPMGLDEYFSAFRRHAGSASTANALAAFEEDHSVRRRHQPAGLVPRLFHEAIYQYRRANLGYLPWRR